MQNYPLEGNLINLNIKIDENFLNFIREHSILCSLKSGNFKQVQEFSNDQKFPNEPYFYNKELLRQVNRLYSTGKMPLRSYFHHFGFSHPDNLNRVLRQNIDKSEQADTKTLRNLYKDEKTKHFKETCMKKYGVENVFQNEKVKGKIKDTLQTRYGVSHPMLSEDVKDKIKETCLEKYGVDNVAKSKEIQEKIKTTMVSRYGGATTFESPILTEKIKQTNLERYGVENVFQNENVKDKIKETLQTRYGVSHPMFSAEVKEKIKQTNLERYGVENVLQSEAIRDRIKQTNLERYGVLYPMLAEEIKMRAVQEIEQILNCCGRYAELETLTELEEIVAFCKENYSTSHFYKILKRKGFTIPEKFSTPELAIKNLLESLNLNFLTHYRPDFLEGKELDFYIPFSENVGKFPQFQEDSSKVAIAIEINGVYWHSEKFKERNYHQDKKIKCLENGVGLISIADVEISQDKILELLKNPQKILKDVSGLSEIDASLEPFIPLVEVCKQTFHQNETDKSVSLVEGFEFVGFSEPEERFSGYFDCGNLVFKPK